MKKIILNKVTLDEYGVSPFNQEEVEDIHNMIKNNLGDDYTVITSPMDITLVEGDDIIIRIDCKDYTFNELMDIIGKYEQNQ